MQKTDQSPRLTWRDGNVPVSERFEDPYYSLENGLAETRHVFLAGNALPDRLQSGFTVAELGVGTGLNLLALAECAASAGVDGVCYVGFEAYPLDRPDIDRALAPFEDLAPWRDALLEVWPPVANSAKVGPVSASLIPGDARETLRAWDGAADAWFLDGFAPARNPELWQADLMAEVARHTRPGGTFATYTAAGEVRRALTAAGFTVERRPGYGRKRHMTAGKRAL
ncbi:tRNA (5-methylaminomethyl-2-thiouridine)(34)-methyltransferase MnmD [Tropicimonas isoalkanivorans]|uniref:tRNA U34 5-methylaminomethyl-2-thiouridine-forming methyltransferase MnmC n=1 Tax=Tropicimonas isoalkanivorans TaxID=441112 RepID=A0A1I1NY15_9RHOB|nr:tRNA (5-methylaminomethyl-2-thiouridine)(34)-methyltransferase MnmD [Tropicimonas isoalkanivorans]SFD02591.1 tRNA U34 5-methylaminomethyl-2-thiouridine-forming methyltransferase MnmC [Tropicimonas isoalkanivorans]